MNFGWVENRKKKMEKKKYSHRLMTTLTTTCVGQDKVPPHNASPKTTVGYFCTPEEVSHAAQMVWTISIRWRVFIKCQQLFSFFFFNKYQNTSDPHKIYKKLESRKHHTPKDKNMCFKIQGYFVNFTMLKNRKNQKNPSPKAKDIQTPHQF